MLRGCYNRTVDDKGRVPMPPELRGAMRADLDGSLVMTVGFDGCLFLFPVSSYRNFVKKIEVLPNQESKQVRKLKRVFVGASEHLELDKQGRFMIPHEFRERAGINGECMLVGNDDRVEVWSPKRWQAYLDGSDDGQRVEDLAELLGGPGAAQGTVPQVDSP